MSVSVQAVADEAARAYFAAAPEGVGLSVGVLHDGRSYTFNYGAVEKGSHNRPKSNSIYRIASITKTFTGTLLAQAVIEKRASLDDDVRKYLADPYPNLAFDGQPIRLGHLLNHVSGLPFNLPDIPGNRPPFRTLMTPPVRRLLDGYTPSDFLRDLHAVVLTRTPGADVSYSNVGAVLAALVLERIDGKSYDDLVRDRIDRPLGMKDTSNRLSRSQRTRLLRGYDENGPIPPQPGLLLGAGDLCSTVDDMLKYARWEMDETDDAVRLTHRPTFKNGTYAIGINWQMIQVGENRRVWQEGEVPGFASMCLVFPDRKLAVVVLANELDRKSANALSAMADQIASGLDPTTILTKPQ